MPDGNQKFPLLSVCLLVFKPASTFTALDPKTFDLASTHVILGCSLSHLIYDLPRFCVKRKPIIV